jgi:hypothetical protein
VEQEHVHTLHGMLKRRHKGNIRMDLREQGDVNRWMELAQGYD